MKVVPWGYQPHLAEYMAPFCSGPEIVSESMVERVCVSFSARDQTELQLQQLSAQARLMAAGVPKACMFISVMQAVTGIAVFAYGYRFKDWEERRKKLEAAIAEAESAAAKATAAEKTVERGPDHDAAKGNEQRDDEQAGKGALQRE